MREVVFTDKQKCVGCNRCVRVCPLEECNVAQFESGQVKVTIDTEKCIACGACVSACEHGARQYGDDTVQFFHDLHSGEKISLIVAPSIRSNFKNWESILAWLRTQGAAMVADVSLGADICTWAHIQYVQQQAPDTLITQPCPAIVNYIEKYHEDLLRVLSPVHSPMLCAAIFLRKHLGVKHSIAAISPCMAKAHEFEDTGLVQYNVTFEKLSEYINSQGIRIPKAAFSFDHVNASLGGIYPMPGGLKENIEYYLNKNMRVDKAEGQGIVYRQINDFANEHKDNLPDIFDVLNCQEGCNAGTGCAHTATMFSLNSAMDKVRRQAMEEYQKTDENQSTILFCAFDEQLQLSDFMRTYRPKAIRSIPYNETDVEYAMQRLGKETWEQRNHNCYACGCETCHNMAVRIAKGINTPENCLEKARQDIVDKHRAFIEEQKSSHINLHRIAMEVEAIKQQFDDMLQSVKNVEGVVEQYSKMAAIVEDMSTETQLLSLNAAVEAARAGVAGKGFAVVAQAIRELAGVVKTAVAEVEDTGNFARLTIQDVAKTSKNVDQSILRVSSYIEEISAAMTVET